jgi:HD-like signal output (HDOD) protein
MPQAAQQAFQLATNPKAEAHDYIEVIEADEGLSARVLKIANSVFYDRGGGSKTIADAVNVVGISELKGLLNATALSNVFPLRHPMRRQLWAHDVATAITARLVCRNLLPSCTDQAFLAGLMHDIGKLLLLQRHTDTYDKLVKRGLADGLESVKAEALEYPFDHTEVGHLIGERWNFSAELITVIRNHHQPWSDIPQQSLTAIVKASNILTHVLELAGAGESPSMRRIYEPLLPEAWEFLRVSSSMQRSLSEEVNRCFEHEFELFASWGNG